MPLCIRNSGHVILTRSQLASLAPSSAHFLATEPDLVSDANIRPSGYFPAPPCRFEPVTRLLVAGEDLNLRPSGYERERARRAGLVSVGQSASELLEPAPSVGRSWFPSGAI